MGKKNHSCIRLSIYCSLLILIYSPFSGVLNAQANNELKENLQNFVSLEQRPEAFKVNFTFKLETPGIQKVSGAGHWMVDRLGEVYSEKISELENIEQSENLPKMSDLDQTIYYDLNRTLNINESRREIIISAGKDFTSILAVSIEDIVFLRKGGVPFSEMLMQSVNLAKFYKRGKSELIDFPLIKDGKPLDGYTYTIEFENTSKNEFPKKIILRTRDGLTATLDYSGAISLGSRMIPETITYEVIKEENGTKKILTTQILKIKPENKEIQVSERDFNPILPADYLVRDNVLSRVYRTSKSESNQRN